MINKELLEEKISQYKDQLSKIVASMEEARANALRIEGILLELNSMLEQLNKEEDKVLKEESKDE